MHPFVGDQCINSLPGAVKPTALPISQFSLQHTRYLLLQADKEQESSEKALYLFTQCS